MSCWIQQPKCIFPSVRRGEARPVQLECKTHEVCWIRQVTTRVGAVTCWIQQSVSPKQVVGFTCVFNSEIDEFMRKSLVRNGDESGTPNDSGVISVNRYIGLGLKPL